MSIKELEQEVRRLKAENKRLKRLAFFDALTGLANRVLLRIKLERRKKGQLTGIMYIDLDRFKPINDQFGHDAGDFVLKEVANRFKQCCRKNDIIARIGGDEFVIVLTSLAEKIDVNRVCEKIIDSISQPIRLPNKQEVKIGCSIGVSFAEDIDDALKLADQAMYNVKNNGRDNFELSTI